MRSRPESTRPRIRRHVAAVVVTALVALGVTAPAWSLFGDGVNAAASYNTAVLAQPGNPQVAIFDCTPGGFFQPYTLVFFWTNVPNAIDYEVGYALAATTQPPISLGTIAEPGNAVLITVPFKIRVFLAAQTLNNNWTSGFTPYVSVAPPPANC